MLKKIIVIMVLSLFTFTCFEQTILLELDSEVEWAEDCSSSDTGEEEGTDDLDDVFNVHLNRLNDINGYLTVANKSKAILVAYKRSDHSFEVPYPPPEPC